MRFRRTLKVLWQIPVGVGLGFLLMEWWSFVYDLGLPQPAGLVLSLLPLVAPMLALALWVDLQKTEDP